MHRTPLNSFLLQIECLGIQRTDWQLLAGAHERIGICLRMASMRPCSYLNGILLVQLATESRNTLENSILYYNKEHLIRVASDMPINVVLGD